MSIWEKFESHHNFNTKPNPKVLSNDNLSQTIKPTPNERMFDPEANDWFTPPSKQEYDNALEPDFFEMESIRTREEYMPETAFITKEQKELNLNQYMEKITHAASQFELSKIAQLIFQAQKQKNGMYFFPKGESRRFWAEHKQTKMKFIRNTTKELDDLISSGLNAYEIRRLKKEIYDIKNLDIATKKEYWAKCDRLLNKVA